MNDALIDYLSSVSWSDNDVANCLAKMQPPFCYGRHRGPCASNTRQAGVLVLLHEVNDELSVTLTRRAANLQHHASQISFPGGGVDSGESWQMAAVRETHEEIGVPPESITIITALEPVFVYRSNNLMFPFVAMLTDDSQGIYNEGEVDSMFVVKLSEVREGLGTYSDIAYTWKPVNVPGFRVSEGVIWGATAMVLSQLLSILDDFTG